MDTSLLILLGVEPKKSNNVTLDESVCKTLLPLRWESWDTPDIINNEYDEEPLLLMLISNPLLTSNSPLPICNDTSDSLPSIPDITFDHVAQGLFSLVQLLFVSVPKL